MVKEEIIIDMEYAKRYLATTDLSVVLIKNSEVMDKRTGTGLRPFFDLIGENEDNLCECVVGMRVLGKASALLCRYAHVNGVYSIKGTKTAIAHLILDAIPCQVDQMIPFVKNNNSNDLCVFEQVVRDVDNPIEAFTILHENIMKRDE